MAGITPNTVVRESMGSTTLLICGLTTTSVSDTWAAGTNIPVLDYWAQSQLGGGITAPDVSFNPTSGAFIITGGTTYGPIKLFILART